VKTQQSANEQVIVVLLALLFLGLMCAWQGYVLSVLWGWFFVPTFGVPALSVPAAFGVALVVRFLTHQHNDDERASTVKMTAMALNPAVALCFGWVVKQWM
jgi:hypothetical protein